MLAKKTTKIFKYVFLIVIFLLIVLPVYSFAKESKKAVAKDNSSSKRSSQGQRSTTAPKTISSSQPANRSSSISSKPAQITRQSNVSRSNVRSNRSTRTSNVNRSSVRTNRTTRPRESRPNAGRDTVNKSRIGGVIGDRKRTVVERRNNRISSDLIVRPGQRTDRTQLVRQPVTDRRTAVRADRDESSLTRQKSALQTRQGAETDRLIRDNSTRNTRARVDSERRSREQLGQRSDRKGIVVKNLSYRRGRRSGRVVYQDRPYGIRHTNHTEHVYRDYYGSLCHRIIWPRFSG